MADEVFALSPISARATKPSDEDYAAISEAFMETSRGRWFLTEYAKRNRNADTRLVLDAVTRIEQNLATQKDERLQREENLRREEAIAAQEQAVAATARAATASAEAAAASAEAVAATAAATAAAAAAAAAEKSLNEALGAARAAVEAAQESAVEAIDSLALEQRLAPVRKGARVLREIAWRLREIGNDGRICDLIDSQVAVIEKGTQQISSEEARIALRAAFAALEGRLATFSDEERALAAAETKSPEIRTPETSPLDIWTAATKAAPPTPAQRPAPPATFAETIETTPAQHASEPPSASLAATVDAGLAETAEAPAATELAVEAAEAQDEAILDAIAMEMGAPEDPISDEEIAAAIAEPSRAHQPPPVATDIVKPEIIKPEVVEPEIVKPAVVAAAPEPVVTRPVEPPVQMAIQPPQPVAQVEPAPVPASAAPSAPAPAMEMSLGSTIIASGILQKPAAAANDPLAPIRRMSQAEKIAFFS